MGSGEEISDQTQQLIVMRISELLNAFEESDPNAARQLRKQLADSAASLAEERQMAATPDGEQGQQQEVMPQQGV